MISRINKQVDYLSAKDKALHKLTYALLHIFSTKN